MNKQKEVDKLIEHIEAVLQRLQKLTGRNHISAFVIDDFYNFRAVKDGDKKDIGIDVSKIGGKKV